MLGVKQDGSDLSIRIIFLVSDSDSVARLGGDEFGMLLVGCPLEKARQIADDVCQVVRDYRFVWRDQIFTIGLVAQVPQPVLVSEGLVNVPAEAMFNWNPGAQFGLYRPETFFWAK